MTNDKVTMPPAAKTLLERFVRGDATIGVIGLGYVGLPLAIVLADAGYHVIGLDADPEKVAAIKEGRSYIEDVPTDVLSKHVEAGMLQATMDYNDLREVQGISICVPTPLRKTGDPDLSYIVSVAESLKEILHPELVVVLESTTYPGTTREMVQPALESTGLVVGEDIFLAFSPERVDPGREDHTTVNTPKVVGGITPTCTKVSGAMYGQAMQSVIEVSSSEVAEMAKLLENTFRAVNIGLVNELALMCERLGIDVWEVIDAAASKPFGFMKFTPGPGLGGHCIPIDPLYLSWKLKSVKYNARFIELASEINTNMPRYVIQRVQAVMNEAEKSVKGSKILVLGAAYKPDVSDVRESPALDVIGMLRDQGAQVQYYDPHVPGLDHEGWQMESIEDLFTAIGDVDLVVLITDHADFDYDRIAKEAKLIFDTRNAFRTRGILREHIETI